MRKLTSALCLLTFLLGGCSFLSKSQSKYFSLDRIPPDARIVAARGGLPVGISTVELPPGVDRKEIAVRQANQQLDIRGGEQWTASLQPLVLETLAVDVADRLPLDMAVLPGESKPAAMRSIDVVFEELAAGPSNVVRLDARWIEHTPGRADVAHHESLAIDIPSLDSANVAAGMSRAIATLADRIAAAQATS